MEQVQRAEEAERTARIPEGGGGLAQPVLAGVVTALVGFSSSFVLVLAGLRAVGASNSQAVSGLLLLSVGMGLLAVWLGLRHRQPVSIAWSTPGAALLVASGVPAGGYRYAVGAFLISAVLLTLTGLWSRLRELVTAIPAPLATALLAGVILPLCLAPVRAAVELPGLALPVIAVWAVLTRYARRWATPGAVATAVVAVLIHPIRQPGPALGLLPSVSFSAPGFSLAALVGIALPLYVITMASQNIPGIAVLRHFGYEPPVRAALTGAGLVSTATALGGGFAVNLAAISAALAAGPDAGPDPKRRWVASVTAGALYVVLGLSAGLAAALLTSTPPLLVEAAAGLALLPTLGSALAAALGAAEHREAAVLTFVVTASGITAFGIGAPFWALLAGLVAYRLLPAPTPAPTQVTPRVRG